LGKTPQLPFLRYGAFFPTRLRSQYLPKLDTCVGWVLEKLNNGITVADIGCGHGVSLIMAKAFPRSTFYGFDLYPAMILEARP
jgi:trans-aconitate methyltransferase